ncbi:MAG: GNAT family N-acetyltransferase [Rhodobacteraceae bacterium]|nr:GNAT family N-acetyltransferase [Paracoccaceae bacterium]
MITVAKADPHHPQATALLQASHAMMVRMFPAESNHYLSIDDLCAARITFFTARIGDTVLGTGALADKGKYGEVKSMFVSPEARGTGTGAAILATIETEARTGSQAYLRLETAPELSAAIRLYQRAGFTFRGPFGDYENDPLSVFMEKPLA